MIRKITIIGATGMIGKPVTQQLIKAGFEITALVRNAEKAKLIFPTGVNFVQGDIQNVVSITQALQNSDAVYISVSVLPEDKKDGFNAEAGGLENILSAVRTASVRKVVFLSSLIARNYTGNWWVMNVKKNAIGIIKKSDIPYTIFYPSTLMENFENGMRDANKINTIGKSDEKAWWIAGEDFGRQVVNSLAMDDKVNREYVVQGLEPFTTKQAAEVYIKNYGHTNLTLANLPMGLAKFLALFIKPLKFAVPLMEVLNQNKETLESRKTWDELGKPIVTLSSYAKGLSSEK